MDITRPSVPEAVACLLLVIVLVSLLHNLFSSKWPPLPPSPPGEFLLGHLRVIPQSGTAEAYARWGREYNSDVVYVRALRQPIVVLNSLDAAKDLLCKRGANYSDRPRFTLFEIMGWRATLTFLPYGPQWRLHRKILQTSFTASRVREWHSLQTRETRRAAISIIDRPEDWSDHMMRYCVAIGLKAGYGVDITSDDDPYIRIANDAVYVTGNGGVPAGSIVDVFPMARHLPDWLVRDWPLKFAREWGWAIRRLHDVPFAAVCSEVDNGARKDSFAHSLLREYKQNEKRGQQQTYTLDDIKGASGAVFIAGTDTTWATLVIFMLNMVLHPEVQRKAQELLDSVVGTDRLPEFSDRPSLAYIDHIVHEVYRWSPLAPLGIPHKSVQDDIYDGMHIPKDERYPDSRSPGSLVFANVHAMSRDESVYRDPESFNPDRYSSLPDGSPGEPLPAGHFGFGRRSCIGRHLADNSVWITAATFLSLFHIEKKRGPDGSVVEPVVKFTNGGTCHPEHFECSIRPRSKKATELLTRRE